MQSPRLVPCRHSRRGMIADLTAASLLANTLPASVLDCDGVRAPDRPADGGRSGRQAKQARWPKSTLIHTSCRLSRVIGTAGQARGQGQEQVRYPVGTLSLKLPVVPGPGYTLRRRSATRARSHVTPGTREAEGQRRRGGEERRNLSDGVMHISRRHLRPDTHRAHSALRLTRLPLPSRCSRHQQLTS